VTTRHPLRVVTVEDPVEIVLKDRRSVVIQREVGLDVPTTAAGLRAAARTDVDVLLISEIADRESGELALTAAETGRLVLAGVLAARAAAAVPRLVGLWETEGRAAVRARFGAALRGVLYQRLIAKGAAGKGRTAEAEIVSGGAAAAASSL